MEFIPAQQGSILRFIFIAIVIGVRFESVTADTSANITINCAHRRLTVQGDSISIAEVIASAKCWSDAKQIDIYALDTVIFDEDIDKREQSINITIIAPTWEIIPFLTKNQTQRQIFLNARHEVNFVGMCIDKINEDQLQFHVDGDNNQTNVYNSGKTDEKMYCDYFRKECSFFC